MTGARPARPHRDRADRLIHAVGSDPREGCTEQRIGRDVGERDPGGAILHDIRDHLAEQRVGGEHAAARPEHGGRQADELECGCGGVHPFHFEPRREQHGPREMRSQAIEPVDHVPAQGTDAPLAFGVDDERVAARCENRRRDPVAIAAWKPEVAVHRLVRHLGFGDDVGVGDKPGTPQRQQSPRAFVRRVLPEVDLDQLIAFGRRSDPTIEAAALRDQDGVARAGRLSEVNQDVAPQLRHDGSLVDAVDQHLVRRAPHSSLSVPSTANVSRDILAPQPLIYVGERWTLAMIASQRSQG
jgi:hypothetical protein